MKILFKNGKTLKITKDDASLISTAMKRLRNIIYVYLILLPIIILLLLLDTLWNKITKPTKIDETKKYWHRLAKYADRQLNKVGI